MQAAESHSNGLLARHRRKVFAAAAIAATIAAAVQLSVPSAPVSAAAAPAQFATRAPESFADLVQAVQPAVVNIATTTPIESRGFPQLPFPEGSPMERYFREFFGRGFPEGRDGPAPEARSLGSGFIIDPDGYVVTSNHVIEKAKEVTITLQDGDQYPARLVGHDAKTDLALLKIDADEPLLYVTFGDSDAARVGDWVIAVGNPFGLGGSVSAGIISARGRDIQAGPFDDFLQIDAPINRGSSGGPLFDKEGKVIGVNSAIFSPNGGNIGIGFAIPSAMARDIVAELKESGRVERGWLGVRIQEISDDIAESLGMDEARGALVASVEPGSPAADAGLQTGDVILEFNGHEVNKLKDLPRVVADAQAGQEANIGILREGEQRNLEVTVGQMPGDEGQTLAGKDPDASEADKARIGVALAPLTPETRQRLGLPRDAEGVVVVDVKRGGPAARKGLRPGDVIKRVGNREVNTPDEVVEALNAHDGDKSILLLVSRGGNDHFIAVPLDKA